MMQTVTPWAVVLLLSLNGSPGQAQGQGVPDTIRLKARLDSTRAQFLHLQPLLDSLSDQAPPAEWTIRGPTVIALVGLTSPRDSTTVFAEARLAVERLGYEFVVKAVRWRRSTSRVTLSFDGFRVVDPRGGVYLVPSDLTAGYLVIAPGRRPRLVRGYVTTERLMREILDYERPNRELIGS